eukprot:scpid106136/ scgid16083/ 
MRTMDSWTVPQSVDCWSCGSRPRKGTKLTAEFMKKGTKKRVDCDGVEEQQPAEQKAQHQETPSPEPSRVHAHRTNKKSTKSQFRIRASFAPRLVVVDFYFFMKTEHKL